MREYIEIKNERKVIDNFKWDQLFFSHGRLDAFQNRKELLWAFCPGSYEIAVYPTLIRQGIVPQTLHSHLIYPISTCTIALERVANLPRLPGQEDESVRVKIQQRACWII